MNLANSHLHSNSTRSLYDSDVVYIDIHGRRYCKDYYMPNDIVEQERLQMLNGVFHYVLGHRLTTVPLSNPDKILDVGTGTGEWAMAMGDEFPEAEVIGTDIAKIQPSAVPLNVFFEIDDAEEEGGWAWPDDEFDLVHFRYMKGAFKDWKYIYREVYRHLKPGGWVEILDFDDHKRIQGFFGPESGVTRWIQAINEGTEILGRSRSISHLEPQYLTELGFVDVESKVYKIPVGIWPDDPEAQAVGKHFLIAILNGMEAFCLRVLVEQMGWKIEEIQKVLEEIGDATWSIATNPEKAQGMAFEIKVLTGRKPGW